MKGLIETQNSKSTSVKHFRQLNVDGSNFHVLKMTIYSYKSSNKNSQLHLALFKSDKWPIKR